jgi:DNA-binding CsgD family transcriptional regulator
MRSVSEGVNELKPLERRAQSDDHLVMTMKLKYPYKTATGCSSFPLTGMEGALADADLATTSEVVTLNQNPGSGLCEQIAPRRWDGASVPEGDEFEPSPLTESRESACPPGCRVCFLARKYGLTPREVTLIALISSGRSIRAMSTILGLGITTIRECCRTIHRKIGTHSPLAIGLWAIREGMVKSAVQPNSGFPLPEPYKGCPT